MRNFAIILVAFAALTVQAVEVPAWVERGILYVETRSTIDSAGKIEYIDRATGKAGELGPYQMTKGAFDMIARKGEQFNNLKTNTAFARVCFVRYITWLYINYSHRDWTIAATRWNVGPHGSIARGIGYIHAVKKGAQQ